MPPFSSGRERRLWLWTLAVVVAIYSTLGPARALADALRERDLLRVSFAVLVLVVVAAVAGRWVKRRPGWREIGVALGVALAYWLTFLRMDSPEERTHLVEYGVVAALVHQALLERVRNGRTVPGPAALTVAITALLGLVDEGIQAVLPSRAFDWRDVFFNALAGFMVIAARLALAPVRLPGWRLWFLWVLAGAVGWGVSMDASSFGEPGQPGVLPSLPALVVPHYLSVGAGGILVGVVQGLLLRGYVAAWKRWVLASLGAVAAGALVALGVGLVGADFGWAAGAGLYGTLAGVLQWRVLREQVARAGWWVLASTAGWVAAIPMGDLEGPPGWAIDGALTGAVLVWLLRRQPGELRPGSAPRPLRARR